jgi:hypothetical protein
MKKLRKAVRPRDPQPVIAVRVPASLHQRITRAAKRSGRTMSDEMAHLLALGFEMQDAFGDRLQIIREANAQAAQIQRSALEAALRRANWRRLGGTPYWLPPEAHGLPPNPQWLDPSADEAVPPPPTLKETGEIS